ncbi:hypothetical protein BH09PLA1_BH09PLA1_20320 [soil metagenome]
MPANFDIEALESRQLLAAGSPGQYLNRTDVERILGAAGSQAQSTQIVAVVDREGELLGVYAGKDSRPTGARDETGARNILLETLTKAIARARTAAYFQSRQDAFTTRTARFIIQDHFPHPVPNTPGGPLYGVQFSSLPGADSLANAPAISGDPGGIPLFKSGEPVGGIGVAGDGADFLTRADLPYDPKVTNPRNVFNGKEEHDFDEAVALAGAGSRYAAPKLVQATEILLDGLRLPFTADRPATGKPNQTLSQLIASGAGSIFNSPFGSGAPRGSPPAPFPTATIAGVSGTLCNTTVPGFGIVGSNDTAGDDSSFRLTKKDVQTIIARAVSEATIIRAGIRQPIGVSVVLQIAVSDADGDLLGVFDMDDATQFSFDIAIQKARTSAFFSDDSHAFSARAVGFLSQRFFPAGINGGLTGPMFHIQDALSLSGPLGIENRAATTPKTGEKNPLRDGITIFPGGFPLYKNGKLVGGIGVSGDGVDQDDICAFAGTRNFRPANGVRSDQLGPGEISSFLTQRVQRISQMFNLDPRFVDVNQVLDNLSGDLNDVQLPYVKFPRNPEI